MPGALAAWFDRADANGDGVIDEAEMGVDAARWFAQADLDHDGQITSDELADIRRRLLPEPEPEPEAPVGMAPPGGGHGGPAGHAVAVPRSQVRVDPVMQADSNADFRVTAQEFRTFTAAHFAELARGGVLSRTQVLDSCVKAAR